MEIINVGHVKSTKVQDLDFSQVVMKIFGQRIEYR